VHGPSQAARDGATRPALAVLGDEREDPAITVAASAKGPELDRERRDEDSPALPAEQQPPKTPPNIQATPAAPTQAAACIRGDGQATASTSARLGDRLTAVKRGRTPSPPSSFQGAAGSDALCLLTGILNGNCTNTIHLKSWNVKRIV
jgi:hypothetical protein